MRLHKIAHDTNQYNFQNYLLIRKCKSCDCISIYPCYTETTKLVILDKVVVTVSKFQFEDEVAYSTIFHPSGVKEISLLYLDFFAIWAVRQVYFPACGHC